MVRNTECRFSAFRLSDAQGETLGYVETCVFTDDTLRLRGWTMSHALSLDIGGTRHRIPRRIQRGDVLAALGPQMMASGNQHGRVGFEVTLPRPRAGGQLVAEDLPGAGPWTLPVPTRLMVRGQRMKTRAAFLRDVLASTPTAMRYFMGGRRRADRDELKRRLGFQTVPGGTSLLNPKFLAVRGPGPGPDCIPPATIIMPVYNAFELLTEAVERIERNTDVPWHLILVEDASPDPRVRPWLEDWASRRAGQVTLLLNSSNLGFVGSVNRGLDLAAQRDGPVILLNSDAMVPSRWASRLLRPILDDMNVASVTPMSNDATILTVPWIAGRVPLEPGMADAIDAAALALSPHARVAIPTGVGFCMALSRAALDRVPRFDTAFGRGYGEEVDWCRKASRGGMVHVGIGNLFVEHVGGQSFGDADKIRAMASSARIISTRYPEFDDEVQRFIAADPLLTARLCLALAHGAAADSSPLHVYLGHSLGGGAEHWLADRIAEREAQGRATAVIRIGGARRFRIELHLGGSNLAGETDEIDVVRRLFARIPARHVVYSCGVGDERPWELPDLLCDLAADRGSTLEILFHDYFPISPSLNLVNADGSYTGVPPPDSTDPAHRIGSDAVSMPLAGWREHWGTAIHRADRLTVFSESSARIVEEVWPEARDRIACQPHRAMIEVPPLLRPCQKGPGVIGVLGAIGAVKGAQIVSDLAYLLDRLPNGPRLVIVGEFDHSFPLPVSAKVTGRYDPASLPGMLSTHGVTAWLMPSIWPETFSFTTREMLATGLPVMAFDLGAQGEAVRAAPNGHIVPPVPQSIYACYRQLHART